MVSVMMPFADRAAAAAQVVLDSDDPEGPHQVRVGLRKARTGLKVFGRKDARARDLGNEARDIAAIVGRLRDLDAVRLDIVGRSCPRMPMRRALPRWTRRCATRPSRCGQRCAR